ncbi:hypothetical protein TSUD_364100 [Trifolium subterraneum]|uniref:Uncharacterized protein n=1 Tax=Trifolium subterraneum TaxID=3900 RepID=A0A2Z6MS41_TRISU|nr:hypothetical protein TSUD_364100 [Trifolium subterraneum]
MHQSSTSFSPPVPHGTLFLPPTSPPVISQCKKVSKTPMSFSSMREGFLFVLFGIFFDTYGEYYEDLREFHQHLLVLLKPGGIYSFFNGLCGSNAFFHVVYCHLVSLELENLGYSTQLIPS